MKTLLFKPFEKYSENRLLITGLLALFIGTGLAFLLNTRFDGALDIHYGMEVQFQTAVIDQALALVSLVLFLFLAGILVNPKTRFVDILSTVLIARIPLYLASLLNLGGYTSSAGLEIEQSMLHEGSEISPFAIVLMVVSIVVILPLIVWSFVLLWNGYKTAANAKGVKAILLFIGAALLAEITSKIVLEFLK